MNYLKYVALVLIAGAVGFGLARYFSVPSVVAGSPAGSTFNDAKFAAVSMAPATSAASTTSILNTDGSGRWLSGELVACTGIGTSGTSVANLTVQAATTSVSGAGLGGNTNLAMNIVVSTTSAAFSMNASSTLASGVSTGTDLYYWPAGTYLSFLFNSTNVGTCVVKADYTPS